MVLLTLLAVMMGCAVTKVPVATGGSRADGTVQLAFEYGGFERPQVDWDSARITAGQRCRAWGYTRSRLVEPSPIARRLISTAVCGFWSH